MCHMHACVERRYVPEVASFPDKYIYSPWEAPLREQVLHFVHNVLTGDSVSFAELRLG